MGKLGLVVMFVSSVAVADKVAAPPPGAKAPPPAAVAAKPVKQMSRGELEKEIEALRADNARLKAKVDDMVAREKERNDRIQKAVGQPATTLK
jgi:hypothetical protein